MKQKITYIVLVACFIACSIISSGNIFAQENAGPLLYNAALQHGPSAGKALKKTTAVSLPFFEDFTSNGAYPDNSKWMDNKVYINNTMCVQPPSRGVATFDALNEYGKPYEPYNNSLYRYTDSLTSQPIDISNNWSGDSLYLSFFYQPQGNGFFPLPKDSLMLYIRKRSGEWVRIWTTPGTTVQPFKQVMIPIKDSIYFSNAFQFRFVNIAALNYSDAIWNIDYIRLNSNRTINDTVVNDVAFSGDPSPILNNYTAMPYRQFMANPQAERAAQYVDSIRNNYSSYQSVNYKYSVREAITNTPLFTSIQSNITLPPTSTQGITYSSYSNTIAMSDPYKRVVFENKYFIDPVTVSDPRANDTIVQHQVFDNYLAYDDGTAEQSYYLTQYPSLPAKLAVEYHLNQPDTLRGVAIYFGRQAPPPNLKSFSIVVYKALQGINGAPSDDLYYQEDDFVPGYNTDTANGFWIYRMANPKPLSPGTFYMGTIQPAFGGSDSLYFGFDKNRTGNNHIYYNTDLTWNSSQLKGAVMIRPLLGQPIIPTDVSAQQRDESIWSISPNPTSNSIQLHYAANITNATYTISDIQGRMLQAGYVNNNRSINISSLLPGMYFVHLRAAGINYVPQKIIKQ